MNAREPLLNPTPIADLKPTQITVGLREVKAKRQEWRHRSAMKGSEFLGTHMIPTVLGPKRRHYVTDHHHLARALLDEGVKVVLVTVQADLSQLSTAGFWKFLDNRAWCHPYDAAGHRRDFDAIPGSIAKLDDDPYRSLAGELRRAGGFAKDTTPFSEFLWADFLRGEVSRKMVDGDFPAALKKAVKLSKDKKSAYLPGWCGPDPE
ncbi:MAG: ParB-like protein [Caulobacterales bacterium]